MLTKENLYQKYIVENKTYNETAKELNISKSRLNQLLNEFNLTGIKNKIIEGQQIGIWTVLKFSHYNPRKDGKKEPVWYCRCKCGKEQNVRQVILRKGNKACKKCTYIGDMPAYVWAKIKVSAKARNRELSITAEYIWNLYQKQNGKCAISGLDIKFQDAKFSVQNAASLDRIDSKKGYIEGNVQWVHVDIQFMKQEYSNEYYIEMSKKVAENNQ